MQVDINYQERCAGVAQELACKACSNSIEQKHKTKRGNYGNGPCAQPTLWELVCVCVCVWVGVGGCVWGKGAALFAIRSFVQEEMKSELAALLGAPNDMIVITAVYEEQAPVQR